MPKLLVIDDDKPLCEMLRVILGPGEYVIDFAHDAQTGRQFVESFGYDLIIMDWELGDTSGASLLKHLRATGCSTPCLILTGRADEQSCEYGLVEAGADDYLTKPFSAVELRARLKSLLRRRGLYFSDVLTLGALALDRSSKSVSTGDKSIELHRTEFLILELLVKHPGIYFTAENLLSRLWDSDTSVSIDNVRMQVSNLRKKLRHIGADELLSTERGLGYVLRATPVANTTE